MFNWTASNPASDDGFYLRLLDMALREANDGSVSQIRCDLMGLALEGYGPGCAAVLLWLVDKTWQGVELRLANVHGRGKEELRPPRLLNITIPWQEGGNFRLPDDAKQRIEAWLLEAQGVSYKGEKIEALCVHADIEGQSPCLGYLQFLLSQASGAAKTMPMPRYQAVACALSRNIDQGRRARRAQAIQELQESQWNKTDVKEILTAAAEVIRRFTRARLCVIYRPAGGMEGRQFRIAAVAADAEAQQRLQRLYPEENYDALSPDANSLTAHIFEQPHIVRIDDIGDQSEIAQRFPTFDIEIDKDILARFDEILGSDHPRVRAAHSRMCAPVRVATLDGEETTIALIKVLGKHGRRHLHDRFSWAEEGILEDAGRSLAAILPGLEVMDAMRSISAALAATPPAEPDKSGALGIIARALLQSLKQYVDDVEAVAFLFDSLSPITIYPTECGWEEDLAAFSHPEMNRILPVPGNKPRWCYAIHPGGGSDGSSGRLLVGLRSNNLPAYQAQIIQRAATAVWFAAHEAAAFGHATQYLIEVRHAIRSGVQGVIGHIDAVQGIYNMVVKADTPEFTQRELIRSAAFRKSLQAGWLAAHQTQELLEEARLIQTNIQFNTLQLGGHSLPAMLREVASIVRPEAESRRLRIELDNRIPSDQERAVFDHKATRIVLFNLLDNAIKYAARDSIIYLHAHIERKFWVVAVENDGIYVDQADRERIFHLFTRVASRDPAARAGISNRPGTGLGLAISRQIIRAHSPDADLAVDSRWLDEGAARARTAFIIRMPRRLNRGDA